MRVLEARHECLTRPSTARLPGCQCGRRPAGRPAARLLARQSLVHLHQHYQPSAFHPCKHMAARPPIPVLTCCCLPHPACLCPVPAGPTLRVRAGTTMSMRLTNELVQPGGHSEGGARHNHASMEGYHGELGRRNQTGGHGAKMQCCQQWRRRRRALAPAASSWHDCPSQSQPPLPLARCRANGHQPPHPR